MNNVPPPNTNGRSTPPRPQMSTATRLRLWTLVILAMVAYLLLRFGVDLYTDYLWFQHLSLESVFTTGVWARVAVGVALAVPFALIFWVNAFVARWLSVRNVLFFSEEVMVAQKFVVWLIWGAGLLLAWLVGTAASTSWLMVLRFLNRQSFNLADPVFGQDAGFYIFTLPFLTFVQTWLLIALFLSLLGAVGVYALAQQNNITEGRVVVLPHVQLHLSVLGALIFFTFAWGHWLDMFDLMYSPRGVAFGASYTDVNVSLPALWVMVAVALATGVILLINILLRKQALSLGAIFIWILVGIIGTGVVPGIVQRYIVEPNELAREAPFIENNIEFTNFAYGLNQIQERDFPSVEPLTPAMVAEEGLFLKNIRLWDYRPLQQTYQQIQAIRLYYRFYDVDLDRYIVNGEMRQVALAARELDKSQLQSPTWVNQKLQFTHGYGVVVNPVNEVTREGLPRLWVKDLPPVTVFDDLAINRPEIYYGEGTNDYVFVNTTEREFNYPSGDQNVFSSYEGTGGVVMDNPLKKLAFAVRLSDLNMLLSQEFTNDSRVMLHRDITSRVREVAPFLQYDRDPYLVINQTDGRLYWIQDAYTTSDSFPYAEPFGGLNYIRNSVKVVIDAYNGSMDFYVVDDSDPLLQAYQLIFPNLFTPGSQIPGWIRAQFRYPEDMFRLQSELYRTYHMQDVNTFYNKEDLWQVPNETFAGNTQPVEPYYVVLKLPGEEESEFALIQPFTPNNKDNLIAWMAARSDGENYGQLVVFRFPKQELIFGPLQIEGRIDQNPEISAQITLWDQGGSEVIRGNLLVLPIGNSLLYVEPLYLRAENGQIPELKRVILASGDSIVMRETLAEALEALFAEQGASFEQAAADDARDSATTAPPAEAPSPAATPLPGASADLLALSVTELAQLASNHYDAAQQALQQGDWATYGDELEQMEAALNALVQKTAAE
ncbi:MAG: UPF0182 family protein [Anaerolineae bacterium]